MKRFFRFLLFLLLLALTVASLQVWSDRRQGAFHGWRKTLLERLDRSRGPERDAFGGGVPARREVVTTEKYTVAEGPRVDLKDVNVLAAMSHERVVLAQAVVPSVVSVITSSNVPAEADKGDPFFFFHRGMRRGGAVTPAQLGSGAIVSKEGHIITNNHVIEGMDRIEVKLSDGRRKPARLIGTDPDTDIAVLKIDAGELQPMPLGDSDAVEVGESVLAVGNPFGLEESVTQGIISAKGRRGSDNISDLFQTDAHIDPGNSGGPLINVRGELIGINEAIYSETGVFQGVGFAIPSSTVRRTMDGILKLGRAVHGYLGIQQRQLDLETASEQGVKDGRGVVVDSIVPGSPADKAALHPGDVIDKFNRKAVNNFEDLRRGVAEVDVDATVPVEVVRDGKTFSVDARIAERPPVAAQLSQAPHYPNGQHALPGGGGDLLGEVKMMNLTPPDLKKLDLPDATRGVLVVDVADGSPAAEMLQVGDVIEQVNQQPVSSINDIKQHLRQLPENHPVILSILRQRSRTTVVINPG